MTVCDGSKVTSLRKKMGYTQEKLAAMASISVRTLQRVEAGDYPLSAENLQDLSLALSVQIQEILRDDAEASVNNVFLFPEKSGSKLVERSILSDRLELYHRFEPSRENMEIVKRFYMSVQQLDPYYFESPRNWHHEIEKNIISRIEIAAELNEIMGVMKALEVPLHVLFSEYVTFGYGRYYQGASWHFEPGERELRVTAVAVAPMTQASLPVARYGIAPRPVQPSEPATPVTDDSLDDIPF